MAFNVVSLTADVPAFRSNGLLDPVVASRFPGALWASEFRRQSPAGIEFLTADVALDRVARGDLDAQCVLVIQHGLDPESAQLIGKGARPFMLTMFESPLYAGRFYDVLPRLAGEFDYVMSFGAPREAPSRVLTNLFPSFSAANVEEMGATCLPLDVRKFASMVVGNKYVLLAPLWKMRTLEDVVWWTAKTVRKWLSGFRLPRGIDLKSCQLQDHRVGVMAALFARGQLDLFGTGWDKLFRLPPSLRRVIGPWLPSGGVSRIDDKISVLGQYRFNICFENVSYPGYVTEKIFDALLAGTVPVYWGAPDISEYVPSGAYIDASGFASFDALAGHLASISDEGCRAMIAEGRAFLQSPLGRAFSYESVGATASHCLEQFLSKEAACASE